jgi:hypothetical protein
MTHLLVLVTERKRLPGVFKSMSVHGWSAEALEPYDLEDRHLAEADVVYFCGGSDQIYLASIRDRLMGFLARGGHLVINDHVAIPWLPFLNRFQAVPPRPYTNWMIRPHQPGAYFGRMDFSTFHVHKGVLGQYSRGYSEPPPGAQLLCMIGAEDDPKPVNWVWRYPGGGRVFFHAGDDIHQFCSRPGREPNLTHDILTAIIAD